MLQCVMIESNFRQICILPFFHQIYTMSKVKYAFDENELEKCVSGRKTEINLESLVVNLWTGQKDLIFLNLEIEFIELLEFLNFKQNLSETWEQVLNYD